MGETKDVKVWFKNRTPFDLIVSITPTASKSFEIGPMTLELTNLAAFGKASRIFSLTALEKDYDAWVTVTAQAFNVANDYLEEG